MNSRSLIHVMTEAPSRYWISAALGWSVRAAPKGLRLVCLRYAVVKADEGHFDSVPYFAIEDGQARTRWRVSFWVSASRDAEGGNRRLQGDMSLSCPN